MSNARLGILGAAAVVLLGAGVFLSQHRSGQQADMAGKPVFGDLESAIGEVQEIRLSKGDGSRTTLRQENGGWMVVERQFPADGVRIRELALALARLRVVETKTADPANYAKLGVEATDSPTATGTRVELVAGNRSWTLIAGKVADNNRALYIRQPEQAASALATPFFNPDPDQKRWLDRLLTDIPGTEVHEVSAQVAKGPAYVLSRASKGAELSLSPLPKGRAAASSMVLNGQADALAGFNFNDVRAITSPPATPDVLTYRTFDGQVFEFRGRREGDKAYVALTASRDPALAAKFAAAPAPAPAEPASSANSAAEKTAPAPDQTVERLAGRTQGVEFEIPAYKYEALFKPYDSLLEPAK